jgi:hypothetical protein
MVAKKAPMKKMTASKKMAKPAMGEDQIRKEIYRKYKLTDKSVIPSSLRRSADPGKAGPISRKEYMQEFDGVVSESSLGTGPKVAKVAMKIAGEQWDRTYGPGNRASKNSQAGDLGRARAAQRAKNKKK